MRIRNVLAGMAAGALLAGWMIVPAAADTSVNGLIAFASNTTEQNPAGDYDIFVMNPDGTGLTNLTERPEDTWDGPHDTQPRWSPDGTKIAFTSPVGWDGEIWVMNADGSDRHALTDNERNEWGPAWSPDGSTIAWTIDDQDHYDFDIWAMNADGSGQHDITGTDETTLHWNEWTPDFMPNGRIVYSGTTYLEVGDASGAYYKIFSMNADGSDPVMLSEGPDPSDDIPNHDEYPRVSPDGAWIAFMMNGQPSQDWDIVVIRTSDGAQFNLTNTYPEAEMFPTWSPDGTKLIFMSNVSEDLYYIEVSSFPTGPASRSTARTARAEALPYQQLTDVGGIKESDWQRLSDGPPPPPPPACTKTGTSAGETLRGTVGRDVICGAGGADTIYGLGGNDLLIGGPGPDVIYGGYGADELRGTTGADDLYGGVGPDLLKGGLGNDDLWGGAGVDSCLQGAGTGVRLSC